ncbi:hypothetical protein GCM10023205_40960 [Yinghuangia aomiensis]|uniref:DOD-type homing endonuclease domain-containing protein n=1 Tax=Yinghuangia aomiensis TaxID=676205 RepID=A0ABP9HHF5_9ACTN
MDLTQPEYAYMFGFLQADGHLHAGPGNKGRLSLEVSSIDRELLLKFQKLCPYPSSVRDRTRSTNFKADHTSSTWSMCSLEGRRTLCALGLPYGKKSTLIRPPTVEFSARDYIRGLVDADGAVGFTAKSYPFISLTTSSDDIAQHFTEFGKAVGGAARNPGKNARDNVFNILYTSDPAVAIVQEIYYEGALTLDRKATKAQAVKAWDRPPTMRARATPTRWTPEDDAMLLGNTNARAAALLGRTEKSCTIRRWRLIGPAKARGTRFHA